MQAGLNKVRASAYRRWLVTCPYGACAHHLFYGWL